jgi:hypothetical protein
MINKIYLIILYILKKQIDRTFNFLVIKQNTGKWTGGLFDKVLKINFKVLKLVARTLQK